MGDIDSNIIAAIIGGVCVLVATFITGIFGLWQGAFATYTPSSRFMLVIVAIFSVIIVLSAGLFGWGYGQLVNSPITNTPTPVPQVTVSKTLASPSPTLDPSLTSTPTSTPEPCIAEPNIEGFVYIYVGPGQDRGRLRLLLEKIEVIRQYINPVNDAMWYSIDDAMWLDAKHVQLSGNCDTLPLADSTPVKRTPSLRPTPTPNNNSAIIPTEIKCTVVGSQGFDSRGFDNCYGIHRDTGTEFDVRGFDVNGTHLNGTQYDAHGFNLNGTHMNGTRYDDKVDPDNPPHDYRGCHLGDSNDCHSDW